MDIIKREETRLDTPRRKKREKEKLIKISF